MKITLEPKSEVIVVTIPDDEDARAFCKAAFEVVTDGTTASGREHLRVSYEEYAKRMVKDKTVPWHRDLWEYGISFTPVKGACRVETTFGAELMARLGLI